MTSDEPTETLYDTPLRARDVRVGDMLWHIEEGGHGPTVLLLHGTGGATHSWSALVPFLITEAHVVSIDLPGHGRTTFPGFSHMSLRDMTDSVAALLRNETISPAVVVSHSAGAAIMLQLAIDGVLGRATRLVGINPALRAPHPAARSMMDGPLGDLMKSRATRAIVRSVGQLAPMIEFLLASTGSRLTTEQERAYVETFKDPDHAESAYAMMANWDLVPLNESLASITQYTTFILGSRDAWVPPSVGEQAAARMPHATTQTIQSGGHLVHEECPAEVAALITPLLHDFTTNA
jgi:magnesium chelatase accessory protein